MKPTTPATCEEQLEQLQKEFDEFAYIVSHDLKAPLRAICNLSGWISEDLGENLDLEVKHNIELLQNRAERMERMINALLQFSRVGRYDLEVSEIDVNALVAQVAAPFELNNRLILHTADLPVLTTYHHKLETVFTHLIQNAVQHNIREVPEIWVKAEVQPEVILFKVKDNGIGISTDSLEKIFKMFYTIQPKDKQETLGAGLTVSKKIIQYLGGTITANSEPGSGTEITFTWPLQ